MMTKKLLTCFLLVAVHQASAQKPSLFDDGPEGQKCIDAMRILLHTPNVLPIHPSPAEIQTIRGLTSDNILVFKGSDLASRPARELLKETKAFLCLAENGMSDLALSEALKRRVQPTKVRVLAVVPETEAELRATFSSLTDSKDADLIKRSLDQMRRAREAWPASTLIRKKPGTTLREQIVAAIEECEPDELVVVFGHNEDGLLRLPDSPPIDLNKLGDFNIRSPIPLVLSCETVLTAPDAVGIKTLKRLDFQDTGKVISRLLKKLEKRDQPESMRRILADLDTEFQALEKVKEVKLRIALGITATGGITLYAVAIPETSDNNADDNQSTDAKNTRNKD